MFPSKSSIVESVLEKTESVFLFITKPSVFTIYPCAEIILEFPILLTILLFLSYVACSV